MSDYISVMVPLAIDDAVVTSTSVSSEDATTVWASGDTFTLGEQRHRVGTHRVYRSLFAGANTTPPENDATLWQDIRATNKWAMFDNRNSSATSATSPLTVVLHPGAFNTIYLDGLVGTGLSVSVKDAPAGVVVFTYTDDLDGRICADEWDYDYEPFRPRKDVLIEGIPPYADMEVTIVLTNSGGAAKCALLTVGDLRPLALTLSDVEPELLDYSYLKTDEFGETQAAQGPSSRAFVARGLLNLTEADGVWDVLDSVRGVTCLWIASGRAQYRALRAFGIGKGKLSYPSQEKCVLSVDVKGII